MMVGATTIDSSGIASLLKVYQITKKRGGLMILASCGELIMIVLALAKMEEVFNVAVDVDAVR
jgi:anti-anti-sigma regulatory factor